MRSFSYRKTFIVGFGFLGISIIWPIFNQYVPIFLQAGNPEFERELLAAGRAIPDVSGFALSPALAFFIMTWDNIINVFIQPWVGERSDHTWNRFGRRKGWILLGVPIAVLGFIFVPMSTLTLATIRRDKLVNATAVYGMLRNVGGSVGIAVVTTLLAQRSQYHQATLVGHINPWDAQTQERLARWSSHFTTLGSDAFTAKRQAMAMIYRETVTQAQLLAYTDDFWLLAMMFAAVPLILPLMRRIRLQPASVVAAEPAKRAPAEEGAV